MGYTTQYEGQINLNKPLDEDTATFLTKLASTRRVKRNLPPEYGVEGEFYVDGKGFLGQDREDSIIDNNTPPSTQPGLWCHWIPTKDKMSIEWDGGEKFYEGEKWMIYIINNVLKPKGYIANGILEAQGEDTNDHWWLKVEDNIVSSTTSLELLSENDAMKEKIEILECPKEDLPLLLKKSHEWADAKNKKLYNKRLNEE